MKLLISVLLCWPLMSWGRVIRLSYDSTQVKQAEHIYQVMQDEHHIPREFIELTASSSPCAQTRLPFSWHLCINDNGDLQEVAVDISFIQETLRVFL